jgi:glucose/arabinose dehydrogenase
VSSERPRPAAPQAMAAAVPAATPAAKSRAGSTVLGGRKGARWVWPGLLAVVGWALPWASYGEPPRVFSDYRSERPGTRHRIRPADLPPPDTSRIASDPPSLIARPLGAWPQTLPGLAVTEYARGFDMARLLRTAPNGDVFLADSSAGKVYVLRGTDAAGRCRSCTVFARTGDKPYGIAFYPPGPAPRWVYVANTDSVVRFRYQLGDTEARGLPQTVVDHLPTGGHWTRDLTFSPDGQRMMITVGSQSNVNDPDTTPAERGRACVLVGKPDGSQLRTLVRGTRNPSSLAWSPVTGQLWASVIERDLLGDNLVPDYVTHLEEGGFYGWPYFYIGNHPDPRHHGKHPELAGRVKVPDVLLQPHCSPLQITFYTGTALGASFRNDLFATVHGSWNRSQRTGYSVLHLPMTAQGQAQGDYEELVTGFVTPEGKVWGRPVGITTAGDGALLFSDDASNTVWRVARRP